MLTVDMYAKIINDMSYTKRINPIYIVRAPTLYIRAVHIHVPDWADMLDTFRQMRIV